MPYIIYEDPESPAATSETLAEAFAEVVRRCGYEPVWANRGGEVQLQLRDQDDASKDQTNEAGQPEGSPQETFSVPGNGGGEFARRLIMQQVVSGGLRGWYATRISNADLANVVLPKQVALG